MCILPLLLVGCSSGTVLAPVDSRGNQNIPPGSSIPRPAPLASAPSRSLPARHAAAGGNPDYYVVKRGDTLYSIAWQHGLAYQQLAASNGVRYPYTIYAGQRLRLQDAPAAGPAAHAQPKAAHTRPLRQARAAPAAVPVPPPPAAPAPAPAPAPAAAQARRAPDTAAAADAGEAGYDGRWVWPTRGRILRNFQSSGLGKKGIGIGGHEGQPVKAAASGKVVYVGSGLVGYGRLIIIKHNENLLSAYGHNSKLLVAEGDNVKAGQQIAEMGSSGTNRTELYFEIRKDGKSVNPLQYLPGA